MNTPRDLYLEERRARILENIAVAGRASVAELSRRFGVSEVTIRADLQSLADSAIRNPKSAPLRIQGTTAIRNSHCRWPRVASCR